MKETTTNRHGTSNEVRFVFFGTPEPAVEILEYLNQTGLVPSIVVTNPDKTPAKTWADAHGIPTLQPEKLDEHFIAKMQKDSWDLFIVVAYGKIMPQTILDIPKFGSLNVHYSFLPKYRGASPIESQILANDKNPGITIMKLVEKMDQGPILGSAPVPIASWPPTARELRKASNEVAGHMLVELIPKWVLGEIKESEQDHSTATYTRKFTKEDGLIDLKQNPYQNYLKIQALSESPKTYFFIERKGKKMRVIIKKAYMEDEKLVLERVIPEGRKEMDFEDFTHGFVSSNTAG